MKKLLTGLAMLFVLATQRDKLDALNKSLEKPSEPDWTAEQSEALEEIKAMYKSDTPEEYQGSFFEDESHRTTFQIAEYHISRLNIYYQSSLKMGEINLGAARTNKNFTQWLASETGKNVKEDDAKTALQFIEATSEIRGALDKLKRLQELSDLVGINFSDFTHPNRDRALHAQFGLE